MKTIFRLLAVTVIALLAMTSTSVAQSLADLDIQAIKSIQLKSSDNLNYTADVVIVLINKSQTADLKLKDAKFDVSFKPAGDESAIPFGVANIKEQEVKMNSTAEVKLADLKIGSKNEQTIGRIFGLFNLLGNPEKEFTMLLNGTTEVGSKAPKGWIYQSGLRAELEFSPSVQKEFLFK